jgi:hypothetical protein
VSDQGGILEARAQLLVQQGCFHPVNDQTDGQKLLLDKLASLSCSHLSASSHWRRTRAISPLSQ